MKWFFAALFILSFVIGSFVAFTSWNLKRNTVKVYNQSVVNAPFDVIIVPGLPYDTSHQNILFKVRILWAKNLFDKGIAKNIIFSGSAVHTPWVEAKVMKILADSLGIPTANTFVEGKAQHGNENIYYSVQLANKLGFRKVALATDQYQNAFLSSFMKKLMTGVAQLPVSVDSFSVYDKIKLPGINASSAFVPGFVPLAKRVSRWQRFCSSMRTDIIEANQ